MLPVQDFGTVFGPEAEARALKLDRLPDAVMQHINGRAAQAKPATDETLRLPQGSTGWELMLAFGLTVMLGAKSAGGRSAIGLRGQALTAGVGPMRPTSARGSKRWPAARLFTGLAGGGTGWREV